MLTEDLKSSPDTKLLLQKHKDLLDLVQIPTDLEKCPHLLVPTTNDHINTRLFVNGKRDPTENTMFADDNLLAEAWSHL